ncbi:MAG: 1-phosphofructokinase [Fusobacterium sp.]|nr:1-phosphofructokinase [Fusobacterium sp.]
MKKILTITLNPAIDVRYNISNLNIGEVNRIPKLEKKAGGKGINVSRVVKDLGGDILASGIVGGFTGKLFLTKLNKNNIKNNFLETENETRTCIALIEENKEKITEFLEAGIGSKEIFDNFLEKYIDILNKEKIEIICASGSLLSGLPKNSYNILIKEAKKRNIKFILDTSGLALTEAIKENPFLIKPNKEELENILDKKFNSIDEIINSGKELVKNGLENIMITLGADGALFITQDNIYRAIFPKVEIKNTVGSGDSTIGGMAYALASGLEIKECFKLAVACGTTNAMLDTTGNIDKIILEEILDKIEIVKI